MGALHDPFIRGSCWTNLARRKAQDLLAWDLPIQDLPTRMHNRICPPGIDPPGCGRDLPTWDLPSCTQDLPIPMDLMPTQNLPERVSLGTSRHVHAFPCFGERAGRTPQGPGSASLGSVHPGSVHPGSAHHHAWDLHRGRAQPRACECGLWARLGACPCTLGP